MYIFTPLGTTKTITAAATSSRVALPVLDTVTEAAGGRSVRVFNATAVIVFIEFGTVATDATTASCPIPAGAVEFFEIGPQVTYVAGITAAGGGTVYFTEGYGS